MHRILNTGKSGLAAIQEKLDIISNNIANTQTNGYKKLKINFESLLNNSIENNGTPISNKDGQQNFAIGIGSKVSKTYRDIGQGVIVRSENLYSIAIEGDGYFGILDDNDNLYLTRNGDLKLSNYGYFIDDLGNTVDIEYLSGGVTPGSFLKINKVGQIIEIDKTGEKAVIGQMKIYSIEDYDLIKEAGNGYIIADKIELIDLENSKTILRQGYIESSNVDIAEELIQMLITQRVYGLNIKSLKAADEMWSLANSMKR